MALVFEIDTLDGLEESVKSLYKPHGEKFRLDVSGIDPADELKGALQREREERKAAKARAEQLEREKAEAEEERLREKSEFKELYEREKLSAQKLREEWEAEKAATNKEKINSAAVKIGVALGDQESSIKLLTREAKDFIAIENGQIKYEIGGIEVDEAAVTKYLIENFGNICKSSGASGGGTTGSRNGGAGKKLSDMTEAERIEFKKRDPEGFKRQLSK